MKTFVEVVKTRVIDALRNRFSVILYDWSAKSTHYLAVISSYPYNSIEAYETALLGFSPK